MVVYVTITGILIYLNKHREELRVSANLSYLALMGVFGLAVFIFFIVTEWKIFSKADKPGWAALIPFYNIYVRSDIAFGNSSYFIVFMVLGVISFIGRISEIGSLRLLAGLAALVLYIIYCVKISKAFGKSGGFAVGLVLLPFIFFPILGFGDDKYIGPQKN